MGLKDLFYRLTQRNCAEHYIPPRFYLLDYLSVLKKTLSLKKSRFSPLMFLSFIFSSKTDFILAIAPLRKKYKNDPDYFPPPGYGLPPRQQSQYSEKEVPKDAKYSFYLYPGKLGKWHLGLSVGIGMLTGLPILLYGYQTSNPSYNFGFYFSFLILYLLTAWWLYHRLFKRWNTPVLRHLWENWPKPFYNSLLSVPHHIKLEKKHRKYPRSIYWNPDKKSCWLRQSTYSAPERATLQDVMLNLAIFEFFFKSDSHKKTKKSEKISIFKHWIFFMFAPFWINLLLLLIMLTAFHMFPSNIFSFPCTSTIANLPYNFVFVILFWSFAALFFILGQLPKLEILHNRIEEGYFDARLEKVPQQILNAIEKQIPTKEEVSQTIQQMQQATVWINIGVLANMFVMLEVLGSVS